MVPIPLLHCHRAMGRISKYCFNRLRSRNDVIRFERNVIINKWNIKTHLLTLLSAKSLVNNGSILNRLQNKMDSQPALMLSLSCTIHQPCWVMKRSIAFYNLLHTIGVLNVLCLVSHCWNCNLRRRF